MKLSLKLLKHMELDRGYTYGNNRNSISKLDHHACFNVCRIVSNTCNVRMATNCMELHRSFYVFNSCDGVLVCNLKGVFKMIRSIIICLISFLLGYVTTPYDPTETNKDAKLFQLIALAASIATVITLALM